MKVVSTDQMRQLDRETIEGYKIPGQTLMDRAGFGVAHIVESLFESHWIESADVLLIAGRGNNGGDAFVAARYLKEHGYSVQVWLTCTAVQIRGDALAHFNKMKTAGIPYKELATEDAWMQMMKAKGKGPLPAAGVVVDGILGTGIKGKARGIAANAIRYINSRFENALVVSVDIPSGLDSDRGVASGDTVIADITVTMGLPKKGLIEPAAVNYVGHLEIIDIGIPEVLIDAVKSDIELVTEYDIRPLLPHRERNAHKGNYGHLLIVGGAAGYAGAIIMAARAAIRSGAGLVTGVVPSGIASVVAGAVPEAMIYGAPQTGSGSLASQAWPFLSSMADKFSVVLLGPGMTRDKQISILVRAVLKNCSKPLIMDADALNVFQGCLDELSRASCPLVITPHPGEMSRLLGCSTAEVQANRFDAAKKVATATHAVTVLKGAGTLIAKEGNPLNINTTGNPGMATGGMGDALAGLMGGLLAQGLDPFDAARAAVYIHGKAGDEAAFQTTQCALTASDVIDYIPSAFHRLTLR